MKAVAIITIIWGSINALGSLISIPIMWIEKIIFTRVPFNQHGEMGAVDFPGFFENIFNLMLIFMPLAVVIHTLYIFSGVKILQKKNDGVNMIRFASIFAILWYVSYAISYQKAFTYLLGGIPEAERFATFIYWVSIFVGGIFAVGYPVFVLIFFRKQKDYFPKN